MKTPIKSYPLLGFKISPMTIERIIDAIGDMVATDSTRVIASLNLHAIYCFFKDPRFRELHLRDHTFVRIDGMPIIMAGRLAGLPVTRAHRTVWLEWIELVFEHAARNGWRVYYMGSRRDAFEKGLAKFRELQPTLQIEGRDGFFDARPGSAENNAVVERINAFKPNILIVGMGMGRQEHWILDNIDALNANCIITAGALIEYFAGTVPTAPRWTGRVGLEWAYRFCTNPRRFTFRYLIEPWLMVWLIAAYHIRGGFGIKRTE